MDEELPTLRIGQAPRQKLAETVAQQILAAVRDLEPGTRLPSEREKDALVASGEQVSAALLALALQDLGLDAISFLGHQVRIATDSAFGRARIRSIDRHRLLASLERGTIAVVAGFQGVDSDNNITTLGRGGSDTTGVALARMHRTGVAVRMVERRLVCFTVALH